MLIIFKIYKTILILNIAINMVPDHSTNFILYSSQKYPLLAFIIHRVYNQISTACGIIVEISGLFMNFQLSSWWEWISYSNWSSWNI